MSHISDYLLLRTPVQRLGSATHAGVSRAAPGKLSKSRIALSLLGLVFGIVTSFFISGITAAWAHGGAELAADRAGPVTPPASGLSPTATSSELSSIAERPRLRYRAGKELAAIAVISLIICLLTYPGLYRTLGLYTNEPTFLILFVSFEYGFFWQALIGGGSTLLQLASS